LGAGLLTKTLTAIEKGAAVAVPQDSSLATYAPMLDKTMCPIDWNKTAQQIHNHVRGMNPWPVATTELGGKRFKIHETAVVGETTGKTPGSVLELTKTGLKMACGEGTVIEIRQLQAEGGKRMAAPDYFRGHPLEL
jgi:methionyl-tRNA formyltransferase